MKSVTRILFLTGGWLSLILGAIGVFLPILPTTPFLILAAFCFSRSSRRVHQWLLSQKLFGPLIQAWEEHGVIPFRAKCLSTTMMLLLISYPMLFMQIPVLGKTLMGLSIVCVLIYIWTRPSVPRALVQDSK